MSGEKGIEELHQEAIKLRELFFSAGERMSEFTEATSSATAHGAAATRMLETLGARTDDLIGEIASFKAASNAELASLRKKLEEAEGALAPFASVADFDIGDDETDGDLFRPMISHNHAPLLTVGDLRRASDALASLQKEQG